MPMADDAVAGDAVTDIATPGALHDAIAALQAQGAPRREPVRFHAVAALARRSQAQTGAVRQLLEVRLSTVLADLQQRLAAAPAAPAPTAATMAAGRVAPQRQPGPLALLVQQAGRPAAAGTQPELRAVQQFGSTWARLRVDQHLVRAQAQQPENAGPLNSQRLALQTLQTLRGLSPAYLQRFMAHADALLWLEQAASAAPAAPAPNGSGAPGAPLAAGTPRSGAPRSRRAARKAAP